MSSAGHLIERISADFAASDIAYGHGTDSAWDEAVYLVLTCSGLADDEQNLSVEISADVVSRIDELAARRISERVPMAYLLGRCRYMGYEFHIVPGLVVPRSPIGYLLTDGLQPWLPDEIGSIIDLCSGTGCLGIVAAHLFPEAEVTLVDIDAKAVKVAEKNVRTHGLADRVDVIHADVLEWRPRQKADLLIVNPPYVDAEDMSGLPPEYQAEPVHGLAAGRDGLEVMAPIIDARSSYLALGGLLVGEVGRSTPALMRRFPRLPFIWPELELGGEGVFVLEASADTSHTSRL